MERIFYKGEVRIKIKDFTCEKCKSHRQTYEFLWGNKTKCAIFSYCDCNKERK